MEDEDKRPARVRAHLFVAGRVQGVAYRAYTQRQARRLGLVGWVRNVSDGRVELVAEGSRADVEALIAWCHEGSPFARVDRVDVAWDDDATSTLKGFEVTH